MADKEIKILYHGEAVTAGQIDCIVDSDVLESKYKKGSFYAVLKIGDKTRNYNVENAACGDALKQLKGKRVVLEFTGNRDDARIFVVGTPPPNPEARRQPAPQNAPQPQERRSTAPSSEAAPAHKEPSQPQQRGSRTAQPPKSKETIELERHNNEMESKRGVSRRSHLMYLCLSGAYYAAKQAHIASGGVLQFEAEAVQKIGVSLYMDCQRDGLHHHLSVKFAAVAPKKEKEGAK
jgi:hypothetical protein